MREQVFAQLVEFAPLHRQKFGPIQEASSSAKQASSTTLPFWDDFSKGIDPNKWISKGASYTETIGNRPPSIGMVLFNGVDAMGRPYSAQEKAQGESDFLISTAIDLSQVNAAQKQSLFLSFFWQAGGKAELPDASDHLLLQVLTPENAWLTIWEKEGGDSRDPSLFVQEILPILPEWQHADFQFRFFTSGRLSGPFDSWLIDYIYLHTGRSATNLAYPDRALTQATTVRLGDFGAYPWELLEKEQSGKWTTVKNEFQNLENRFKSMEYSVTLRDSSGTAVLPINANTPFNPVPRALERRSIVSRSFAELPLPSSPGDVFFEMSLVTGDALLTEIISTDTIRYTQVDYRDNDRVSTRFPLRDYFAYDQGTADYAAGINQRSGQLAVAYTTPEPVFLTGVSIDFSNARQVNQVLDLVVWSALDKKPLYSKEVVVPAKAAGQEIHYFPLEESVPVSGTFYVGFTQFTNDFLHVGLDKGNDQGKKIHYNIGGGWVQNTKVIGSLLIRPHVSLKGKASGEAAPAATFQVYPNPTEDMLFVEGEFSSLRILDSFGREVLLPRAFTNKGEMLTFKDQQPGLYLVLVQGPAGPQSFRILVKK